MKIKKLLKSKHNESKNQRIVAEIFAEFTYKLITFSDASIRINIFEIFAVFTYKMILFFSELQKLETFKIENLESAYDFDFRICKTIIWYHAIATRIKFYFYDISTISDICFTSFIASDTQRDSFDLVFDVKFVICMEIYIAYLEMI